MGIKHTATDEASLMALTGTLKDALIRLGHCKRKLASLALILRNSSTIAASMKSCCPAGSPVNRAVISAKPLFQLAKETIFTILFTISSCPASLSPSAII